MSKCTLSRQQVTFPLTFLICCCWNVKYLRDCYIAPFFFQGRPKKKRSIVVRNAKESFEAVSESPNFLRLAEKLLHMWFWGFASKFRGPKKNRLFRKVDSHLTKRDKKPPIGFIRIHQIWKFPACLVTELPRDHPYGVEKRVLGRSDRVIGWIMVDPGTGSAEHQFLVTWKTYKKLWKIDDL